jgi:hypothetical protein
VRLWSIHPKYLDAKGLVALWRESLLAKHVLEGKTKGYKNHPQLNRFKDAESPVDAINFYLAAVYEEACARKYTFEKTKINLDCAECKLIVTSGQVAFESKHLLKKLKERDPDKWKDLRKHRQLDPHPMFIIIEGGMAEWEVV